MTAKEKANDLVNKLAPIMPNEHWLTRAKQCASLLVDEITEIINSDWAQVQNNDRVNAYWDEVKDEIEKL